ncbi:hypothetical protein KI387_016769, partial [Taxus chinensis]
FLSKPFFQEWRCHYHGVIVSGPLLFLSLCMSYPEVTGRTFLSSKVMAKCIWMNTSRPSLLHVESWELSMKTSP